MVAQSRKFSPRRYSMYVPAMGYAANIIHAGPHEVNFGPVLLAAAAGILSAQSIATIGSTSTFVSDTADPVTTTTQAEFPYGPGYGRNVTVVASGAATSTVTVKGRDYLGQAMTETMTLNGTTPVLGLKAFKYIDLISWTATGGTTINVGFGSKLGLPYAMSNVLEEMSDGVRQATLGTFVAAVQTDPQTATTGDPRGTYVTTTVLDGTKYISAVFQPLNKVNAAGNGGLHGIAHYYA